MRLGRRARSLALAVIPAVLTASAPAHAARTTERLGPAVVPVSQEVFLELDPARTEFTGSTTVVLEVRESVDRFRIHAEGMEVTRAELVPEDGERRTVSLSSPADDVLEITSDRELAPGSAALELEFTARFGTKSAGLYRVEYEDNAYLFTQFESDDAREAFPCFDEPGFKIPFRLTMAVPEGLLAVTNTPPESESVAGGVRTTVFRATPPMPSYLVAIAVGPFETVEIPGMSVPGRVVVPAGKAGLAGAAAETTPPLLAAAERWFGRPMPYEKLDLIAVPKFWPGAMENAGAITYRDQILLLDPSQDTPSARRTLASITAHELAHQWFGNLVTMQWWDDLWLNESFADWMGAKLTDEVYPELRQGLAELRGAQRNLAADARPSTKPVKRTVHPGEPLMEGVGLAYAKGSAVLRMLEEWMGPETVRQGVLAYLGRNEWGNASAADLWAALDEASGRNVSDMIAGFLEQPGYPFLRVEPLGNGRVRLSQARFRNAGVEMDELSWTVPLVLRWSAGGAIRSRSVLLETESQEIDLGENVPVDWIYPNGGGSGYYRWWIPADELAALAAAASSALEVGERVELLGNLDALLDAGAIDGATYLRTLGAMRDDPDPLVLASLAGAAATIRTTFITPDLEDAFAAWVRGTLRPGLERIGMNPQTGDPEAVAMARPRLLSTLADEGADRDVRTWAHGQMEDYLSGSSTLEPDLAWTAMRIAALDGDEELFQRVRERFEAAPNPRERGAMIGVMSSFRRPAIRDGFLEWAFGNLRPEEFGSVGRSLRETEEGADAYFRFLLDRYDVVATRLTEEFLAFLPRMAGGCSRERIEIAREFFGDPSRAVTGTESSLRRTEDATMDCVRLREREGASVAAFLREL
jgi:alanyl aminopeptidase